MSSLFDLQPRLGIVALLFLFFGATAVAQQPELARRPDPEKRVPTPPPPAPMKLPEKLEPARSANSNGTYQALRQRTVDGEAFTVNHLMLKRDAGEFLLTSGTIYLYGPVGGAYTGAVFLGEGTLHIEPPSAMERRELKMVMKTEVLDQRFTTAVFAFTDGTAGELRKGATGTTSGSGSALSQGEEAQTLFRRDLKYDLEARLLEDEAKPGAGGFFVAVRRTTSRSASSSRP